MEKITTRIPKLKRRQLNSYNHELTKRSNEDGILLPNCLNDDESSSLESRNGLETIMESDESSIKDENQEMSNQKDIKNSNKALLIENYSEVLIQKLRLLDSNNTNLRYYSPNGL
ncbi:MAG: hypothetical protein L0H53_04095 [Candidatus Nitrosocosmicus sp.]|nr:hypothetical protein [Candidatus Nitrosocosmicus sp.]MDN5866843.1 hypothetical protein [Candidatus Nitrosocosmicus sp.]